jgi:hypothetical protein
VHCDRRFTHLDVYRDFNADVAAHGLLAASSMGIEASLFMTKNWNAVRALTPGRKAFDWSRYQTAVEGGALRPLSYVAHPRAYDAVVQAAASELGVSAPMRVVRSSPGIDETTIHRLDIDFVSSVAKLKSIPRFPEPNLAKAFIAFCAEATAADNDVYLLFEV